MNIADKSDAEILNIANPIWDEITAGCRCKDWQRYSQFFTDEDRQNPAHKKDILNQWENNPVLVSLTKERQLLGILRRENKVVVVYKLTNTINDGEYMGSLSLSNLSSNMDSNIKVIGVGLS